MEENKTPGFVPRNRHEKRAAASKARRAARAAAKRADRYQVVMTIGGRRIA